MSKPRKRKQRPKTVAKKFKGKKKRGKLPKKARIGETSTLVRNVKGNKRKITYKMTRDGWRIKKNKKKRL